MQRFSAQISKTTLFSPWHTIFCCSLGGGFVFGKCPTNYKTAHLVRKNSTFFNYSYIPEPTIVTGKLSMFTLSEIIQNFVYRFKGVY